MYMKYLYLPVCCLFAQMSEHNSGTPGPFWKLDRAMQGNVLISVWLEDSKLSWLTFVRKTPDKAGFQIYMLIMRDKKPSILFNPRVTLNINFKLNTYSTFVYDTLLYLAQEPTFAWEQVLPIKVDLYNLTLLNQAKNISLVLPNSPNKSCGKSVKGFISKKPTEITTFYIMYIYEIF